MVSKFNANFSDIFGILGKKKGGWSNSYGKNHKAGPLCLLELLGSTFNLAKFHLKRRDGMYHPCLVLWYTRRSGVPEDQADRVYVNSVLNAFGEQNLNMRALTNLCL